MSSDPGVLIIGTGHAGYTAAREFRRLDADSPLTLVSADDGASYYKPNLSKALAMGKTPDQLVTATAEQMAQTLGATVLAGTPAVRIAPQLREVELTDGRRLRYRTLLLATGARPRRLALDGDAACELLSINSLADYRVFRQRLASDAEILLLGAGLIGCEFANDLAASGHRVTLVDIAATPLTRLLPPACGQALADALCGLGVRWLPGRSVRQLERDGQRLRALLDDGGAIGCDVAVSAVGLAPDTSLAAAAGIACGRGVTVDDHLRTSVEGIHALGDCIEYRGQLMPYILPIAHGARALARTLAGEPTPVRFPPMPVTVKTPVLPTIVCPPPEGLDGDWELVGTAPDLIARCRDARGRLIGFALLGAATAGRGALARELPGLDELLDG